MWFAQKNLSRVSTNNRQKGKDKSINEKKVFVKVMLIKIFSKKF